MSGYYAKLMTPRLAERFRHFNKVAAETEIEYGWPRGTLHFSVLELQANNDRQMGHLLASRGQNYERVLEVANNVESVA